MRKVKVSRPLREIAHLESHILVQDAAGQYYLRPAMWCGIRAFLRPVSKRKVYAWLGMSN